MQTQDRLQDENQRVPFAVFGDWRRGGAAHVSVTCRYVHGDPPRVASVLASGGFRVQRYWTVQQQYWCNEWLPPLVTDRNKIVIYHNFIVATNLQVIILGLFTSLLFNWRKRYRFLETLLWDIALLLSSEALTGRLHWAACKSASLEFSPSSYKSSSPSLTSSWWTRATVMTSATSPPTQRTAKTISIWTDPLRQTSPTSKRNLKALWPQEISKRSLFHPFKIINNTIKISLSQENIRR